MYFVNSQVVHTEKSHYFANMASSMTQATPDVPQTTKRTHAEADLSDGPSNDPSTKSSEPPAKILASETVQESSIANGSSEGSKTKSTDVSTEGKSSPETLKESAPPKEESIVPSDAKKEILISKETTCVPENESSTVKDATSAPSNSDNSLKESTTDSVSKPSSSESLIENPKPSVDKPAASEIDNKSQVANTEAKDESKNSTEKVLDGPLPESSVPNEQKAAKGKESAKSSSTVSDSKANHEKPTKKQKEDSDKKSKPSSATRVSNKTPEQILEHMDKTFVKRRNFITNDYPSIPQFKEKYPELFMGKQLLLEFQRITKIDIDQKIQEFCVRYATAVIEMARGKPGADTVLARWETAKQENETLRQYWDMVTALCLLPLHFEENFVEMVIEIGEDEEVVPEGKIVPVLVARGNIFRTDEFFLIAENTIVQEFEEFTIAFASLYSSYWVFNMVYPQTIDSTYNYIQRCIVRQREPGLVPQICKNFTKALQKWNKSKDNKDKENK